MGKVGSGSGSKSHQLFKENAKNRVDELEEMIKNLTGTSNNAAVIEKMSKMLTEWKAELNQPSPASSQNDGSLASFSSDIFRLLVDDEVTSQLTFPVNPTPEPDNWDFLAIQAPSDHAFYGGDHIGDTPAPNLLDDFHDTSWFLESEGELSSGLIGTIDNLSAFLGEKCALWDCARPAKGMQGCRDYCDQLHVDFANNEGPPGSAPIMRQGGIGFNDDVLFAALIAKTKGKDVGIPECEGAATAKSPWNTPELFNLVLEGQTVREWVFFDKPRRASDSRDRKQKSLPDYTGRGWHSSRTIQLKMLEYGGTKKSYYMDPQPLHNMELHLYAYEINNCNECALYRLELKLPDERKTPKGKSSGNSLADQKQIGRLAAGDDSPFFERGKSSQGDAEDNLGHQNQTFSTNDSCSYGAQYEHESQGFDQCKDMSPGTQYSLTNQLDYQQYNSYQEIESNNFSGQYAEDNEHQTPGLQSTICDPFSVFALTKCALWDCTRPAQGSDYCSLFHGTLALNEGLLCTTPVARPKGICVKDGPLFASLSARRQGKDVGIPECEGATTMKRPWEAPELFDIFLFEGETLREWLFFDKPRKAFESGNRKQRSVAGHSGRGWHASRKQNMEEYGGVKRSYYMDPQPNENYEWHLYEYELVNCDTLTLCRLEFKESIKKKSPRGKVSKDPIVDLQRQMGNLTASRADEEPFVKPENTTNVKGRLR